MILINFDDTMLHQQYDYTQQVRQELKKSNIPYGAHIAIPKYYYLDANKELPIFVSVIENSVDNKKLSTSKNGNLIFSNNITGDIFIRQTFKITKQPHHSTKNKKYKTRLSDDITPLKHTYYAYKYRLLNKSEIPNVTGIWTVTEHSGNFISNSETINIAYKNENNKNIPKYIDSPYPSTEDMGIKTIFSKSSSSPDIIQHEFNLKTPSLDNIKKTKSVILNGSFSINHQLDTSRGYFMVNLLITSSNESYDKIIPLKIPKDKIVLSDNAFVGYFSLDLMPYFNTNKLEEFIVKDDFYITIISGSSISKIIPIFNK